MSDNAEIIVVEILPDAEDDDDLPDSMLCMYKGDVVLCFHAMPTYEQYVQLAETFAELAEAARKAGMQ